jgi:hypothetical protein
MKRKRFIAVQHNQETQTVNTQLGSPLFRAWIQAIKNAVPSALKQILS